MRLLWFGDKHERVTSPENRTDNFVDTQKNKTLEIIEIGKRYKVSGYLQPGDFLDSPKLPEQHLAWLMETWTGMTPYDALRILTSPQSTQLKTADLRFAPLVGVPGNHEMFGNNIKTLDKTSIGFLNKIGFMNFATKEKPFYFYTEEGLKVAVTGSPYHLDIDTPEHIENDYIVKEKLGDFHIHIVHGMLSDKSMGPYVRHTLVEQIKHTKADLTLAGHDHIGFPLTEIDGKYFVNTGAIIRTKNDLKEMNRKPKVLLIDIAKATGLRLKEVYLESALPGEMVLNRQKIVERKKKEERIEEYKKAVRDAGVKKSTDIVEIIRTMAETKDLPLAIRDDVLDRISEKMREMNQTIDGMAEEAYAERLILENFQSHEFNEFTFSRGLNIFVGESGRGKTAVLRACQWIYEGKPTGKRIIRKGASFAKATIYLSNGYVISRYIEAKSGGKNGYFVTDPKTGETEFHNTKYLSEVQKLLGYNEFVIDDDLKYSLNFMKQGSGWFLIGDSYTAPVKAKIIGGIYGTHYADAVSRDLDAEERKISEKIKESQEEILKLDEKIQEYAHLNDMNRTIGEVEQLLAEIQQLTERKEKIDSLVIKRKQIEQVIQEYDEVLGRLGNLEETKVLFEQVNHQVTKRDQLFSLVVKRKELVRRQANLEEAVRRTNDIEKVKLEFEALVALEKRRKNIQQVVAKREQVSLQLKEEQEKIVRTEQVEQARELLIQMQENLRKREEWADKAVKAKRLEEIHKSVVKSLDAITLTVQKTNQLEEVETLLKQVQSDLEKKKKIENVLVVRKRLVTQIASEDAIIKKETNQMAVLTNQYKRLLEEAGTCPVCFGTIDNSTAERIVREYKSA